MARGAVLLMLIVGIGLAAGPVAAQGEGQDYPPITVADIDDLVLGYAIPGTCDAFSPDGSQVIVRHQVSDILVSHEVWDVRAGERRFAVELEDYRYSTYARISPDGRTVAVFEDGLYDISTGAQLIDLAYGYAMTFSPDGAYLAVANSGLYDTTTRQQLFHFQGTRYDNNWPQFSPDGRYLVAWDAVYEVATGETVFELVNGNLGQWRFSPDGSLLAVGAEAVYEVATGERLLTIEGFSTRFSVDGRLLAVDEVVYEVGTWEPYEGTLAEGIPSPDGTMTVLWDEGLYDAANGQMIFAVPAGEGQTHNRVGAFSPDQTLLIVNFWGTCLLYDSEGYPWSYRSGLVDTQGEVLEFSAGDGMPVQDVTGLLVVMARSPDDPWLRVRYPDSFVYRLSLEGWIAADEVAIVALPDGVPVETPVGQSQTDRQ